MWRVSDVRTIRRGHVVTSNDLTTVFGIDYFDTEGHLAETRIRHTAGRRREMQEPNPYDAPRVIPDEEQKSIRTTVLMLLPYSVRHFFTSSYSSCGT